MLWVLLLLLLLLLLLTSTSTSKSKRQRIEKSFIVENCGDPSAHHLRALSAPTRRGREREREIETERRLQCTLHYCNYHCLSLFLSRSLACTNDGVGQIVMVLHDALSTKQHPPPPIPLSTRVSRAPLLASVFFY